MTIARADISVSLDGFVTGPLTSPLDGLGEHADPLHTWAIDSDDPVDDAVLREAAEDSGAVVMGRRTFDVVDAPEGWTDGMAYGARYDTRPPFFVVTHRAPSSVRQTDRSFTFVTDGLAVAIAAARDAAGDRPAVVMGGGDVVGNAVVEGLVDELILHIAPVVLGGGTPLFPAGTSRSLEILDVRPSSTSTHVRYAVR